MPRRSVAATRVLSGLRTDAGESALLQPTLPITHALVILVDTLPNGQVEDTPEAPGAGLSIPTLESSTYEVKTADPPDSSSTGNSNSNPHPVGSPKPWGSKRTYQKHRDLRNNLAPKWFVGWRKLLDAMDIDRRRTRFLVNRYDNHLWALNGGLSPSFTKPEMVTWSAITEGVKSLSEQAKSENGTLLIVYSGRHTTGIRNNQFLISPNDANRKPGAFQLSDLNGLLEKHLDDRGALVILDSFADGSSAPLKAANLRNEDRICIPTGPEHWKLQVLDSTRTRKPAPATNRALLNSHVLSDPSLGIPQVGSDHYLFSQGTSPIKHLLTEGYFSSSQDVEFYSNLYLLFKGSPASTEPPPELLGTFTNRIDRAGLHQETWTLRKDTPLPDTFCAHRVEYDESSGSKVWPWIDYLDALPEATEALVTEEKEIVNYYEKSTQTNKTIEVPYTKINIDELRDQLLPVSTSETFVWSGFFISKDRLPTNGVWYQVTDEKGATACLWYRGSGVPSFQSSNWWSATGTPLTGGVLSFQKLSKPPSSLGDWHRGIGKP